MFGFLSLYHLPCLWNSLELESVILHSICYILAWSLCILHGICYILAWLHFAFCMVFATVLALVNFCILHGICYMLVLQAFMWVS